MTPKQLTELLIGLPKEVQEVPILLASDQEGNEFRLLEGDSQRFWSTGIFEQAGSSSFQEIGTPGLPTHLCLWPGYPKPSAAKR